jgi:hypothetical protein
MNRFVLSVFLVLLTFNASAQVSSWQTTELPVTNQHKLLALTPATIGEVLMIGNQVVALGSAIYDLVQKGKPTVVTEYAAINVLPRDPQTKQYVDPFDLEGTGNAVVRRFVTTGKNATGQVVVRFEHMLQFFPGGSYMGAGKYIQNAIIVPMSVEAGYGYDLTAQMRLVGIMNKGSKTNPIAGASLLLKMTIRKLSKAAEKTLVFNISGNGDVQVQ